jgi:release factor glutamine methyltransferase
MKENVLNYEPSLALFVPDDDPLLFYRAIVLKSEHLLKPGGELYFEINEAYGKEVSEFLTEQGFTAEVYKDINGKNRMIFAHQLSK